MARLLLCFVFLCGLCTTCFSLSTRQAISIDNKVLVFVREHPITVMDVVKKLDLAFYQQHPHLRQVPTARYEFYMAHWQSVLHDLIVRRLALLWAEEKHIQITHGEVREEMEEMTGPNVLLNMYEAGLSIHDMQQMVKEEMLLRRIFFFYVRKYVMDSITPELVRAEYLRRAKEPDMTWAWRSVTVHGHTAVPKEIAERVRTDLLDGIAKPHVPEGVEISVSSVYHSRQAELMASVKEVLMTLKPQEASSPMPWKSRTSEGQGWRFYLLDDRQESPVPSFSSLEYTIREELAAPELEKRSELFFQELRAQYGVIDTMTPDQLAHFVPFALSQ